MPSVIPAWRKRTGRCGVWDRLQCSEEADAAPGLAARGLPAHYCGRRPRRDCRGSGGAVSDDVACGTCAAGAVRIGRRLSALHAPRKDLHQHDHLHVGLRESGVDAAQREWVACQLGVCENPGVEQYKRVEKAERPDGDAPAARSYPLVLHHPEARLYHPPLGVPVDVDLWPVCGKRDVPLLGLFFAGFRLAPLLLFLLRSVMIMVYSA